MGRGPVSCASRRWSKPTRSPWRLWARAIQDGWCLGRWRFSRRRFGSCRLWGGLRKPRFRQPALHHLRWCPQRPLCSRRRVGDSSQTRAGWLFRCSWMNTSGGVALNAQCRRRSLVEVHPVRRSGALGLRQAWGFLAHPKPTRRIPPGLGPPVLSRLEPQRGGFDSRTGQGPSPPQGDARRSSRKLPRP